MSRSDKAIINQLLVRIWDLEQALDYATERLAMWESGEIQHDTTAVEELWTKMGRKQ